MMIAIGSLPKVDPEFHDRPRILVVDDSAETLNILLHALKDDYTVIGARNGDKALRLAEAKPPPDLILLDIMMPGMDGYQVCRRLKADVATRPIPVIFLTALEEEEAETAGLNMGAADYIRKPIRMVTLRLRVKQQLELLQVHRRLEEQNRCLEIAARRYQAVTTSATDAFVTGDADGRIVGWNPGANHIFGYTESEAIGQPVTILMPQSYQDRHLDGMERARSGGVQSIIGKTVELVGSRKDGSEFPLELSLAAWTDGQSPFFTGIIRNISDRKVADEKIKTRSRKLAESNAELEQFAYVASHDLREPLRMINSFLALLSKRNPHLDASSMEFLGYAREGAVRMDNMILALLDLSRVGRTSVAPSPVDSGVAVAEAILNLTALIAETGAKVTMPPAMPAVIGNPEELVRLFQNLIGNAIKYRHPARPSVISVTCAPHETGWRIAVADNGIGIGADDYGSIFHIFQRLHTRDQYEGTGIGLAVCKKIVDHHGGIIWVESILGEGSTFHFTLRGQGDPPWDGQGPRPATTTKACP